MIDKQTGISIGLAASLMGGAVWVGMIDAQVNENARQNQSQWQEIGEVKDSTSKALETVATMAGKVDAIHDILKAR